MTEEQDSEIDTPVSEIMTSPVRTVPADTTIAEAAQILSSEGIGSLIIGEDIIDGIITEMDVVESVGNAMDPETTTVEELMSDPVVTIRPNESARVAGERMGHNGVKKLPVAEDGKAVGIITTTDLALYLPQLRINMTPQPEPDIGKGEYE
ncbi:CBS domain-containing protein [Haloglomus salinum]|jgi:CBS domain-containing protein|uniref:CBS domain-containing protein n=1 Tax=Haloglomus salinum TaxID=2962673 RepID=UPI0020C9C2D3|nr:CBS domain-containing protein [Haloglomus salinum]